MSKSGSAGGGARSGAGHGTRTAVFWAIPAVAVIGGVAYLVASAVGGHPVLGVVLMAVMFAFAAGLVLAARYSETLRGLMDRRDERLNGIDLRATAFTGLVLVLVILVAAIVEMGRGHSGDPYTWLGAIGGGAYIVAVIAQRIRQ